MAPAFIRFVRHLLEKKPHFKVTDLVCLDYPVKEKYYGN